MTADVLTDDPIAARQALADSIAGELRGRGYFLAHLDREGQALIDLEWAALLAGRALGRKTATYVSEVGQRVAGKVTVVVGPRQPFVEQRSARAELATLCDRFAEPA